MIIQGLQATLKMAFYSKAIMIEKLQRKGFMQKRLNKIREILEKTMSIQICKHYFLAEVPPPLPFCQKVLSMIIHPYISPSQYNLQQILTPMSKHKQLYTKNPWHCVSYGAKSPQIVNAVIEIPAESKVKYELDKESGLLKLDRILFSAVHYPHNYGFIPQTYCDDHDPLDILVICSAKVEPLCLVEAKVIGVMRMIDQGEGDDKIIAVANSDMSVSHYNDIKDLPEHLLQQVHRFFEDYKKMEKKEVRVLEFLGHKEAWKIVEDSIKLYKEDFGDKKE